MLESPGEEAKNEQSEGENNDKVEMDKRNILKTRSSTTVDLARGELNKTVSPNRAIEERKLQTAGADSINQQENQEPPENILPASISLVTSRELPQLEKSLKCQYAAGKPNLVDRFETTFSLLRSKPIH